MANVERNRNMGEKLGHFLKTAGLIGAVIGLIGILAEWKLGGTIFMAGLGTAAVGFAGEKLSGSGKKRAYA